MFRVCGRQHEVNFLKNRCGGSLARKGTGSKCGAGLRSWKKGMSPKQTSVLKPSVAKRIVDHTEYERPRHDDFNQSFSASEKMEETKKIRNKKKTTLAREIKGDGGTRR